MLGGGGIAEHEERAVTGGGGIAEPERALSKSIPKAFRL